MKTLLSATTILPALLIAAALVSPAHADDASEIADLMACYARGADTIGDGRSDHDPEAAGLAVFETCFTPTATFAVWPAGQPFDSPRFPSRVGTMPPLAIFPTPASWAAFTNSAFRGSGYDYVQHLISNVEVEITGATTGTAVGNLTSTHVVMGEGLLATSQCVQQSTGTYSFHVEKVSGTWLVNSLDLAQFAYNTIIESGAGC